MGLTIHYSGKIDQPETIPQFVEELTDIADSMGWMPQPINLDETDPEYRGMIDAIAGELRQSEPLPENASVDEIIARIERIVRPR